MTFNRLLVGRSSQGTKRYMLFIKKIKMHNYIKNNIMCISAVMCAIILIGCSADSEKRQAENKNPMKLWYVEPAKIWEEALPIGNGRLGAMVFGGIVSETLQLNEETVWAGEPGNNIQPEIKKHLPIIRQLIFEGKHKEAQELANLYLPKRASSNYGMCYQPAGRLQLNFDGISDVTDYRRELDISNAVASVDYTSNGIQFHREVISSLTDDVIAIEITANKPSSVSCTLSINSEHENKNVKTENNTLLLQGTSSDHENKKGKVKFTTIVKPKLTGGKLIVTDSTLIVSKADKLVVYVSIGTNFKNYNNISDNATRKAKTILDKAFERNYVALKQAHVKKYNNYFDRVEINLGSTDSINNPTDIRLNQFKEANDPQLVALFYQFGRYLLISSSQPGTQAANLQGIWSHKIKPKWDSKYTININTEMNYWPAEPTNLSEMHEPLFSLIDDLSVTGKESALKIYGARGWNLHHNTDIWRISGVVDHGFYGLWPMGGAWLSQHLWYHYLYTGDKDFLREKYTVLKGISQFYMDVMIEEPEHQWMVVSPSVSPENPHHPKVSIAAGTTMDNQLVLDVLNNAIEASDILGIDKTYADSLRMLITKLAPMQIGKWGQLQEWMHDWDRPNDNHRHVSHLYGVFPSNQISPYRTPDLFSAAKTSLLARGDISTGWSMGWKVNLWARFLDGNHALKLISDQLTPSIQDDGRQIGGTYPNLFDAHPPFQIDGNFGCTSGITEMLLQSHDGAIHLLPALPDSWQKGTISGLKARGGFGVTMHWENGQLATATIESKLGGTCRIRSYVPLQGENIKDAKGVNPNQYFHLRKTKKPLIHSKNPINKQELKKIYEYDVETKAGDLIMVSKK